MVKITNWEKAFWAVVTGDEGIKKKILADRAAKRKAAAKKKKAPAKSKKRAGKRKAPAKDLFDLL